MFLRSHFCAEHLPDVFKHPDSDVPIPYTELLITATPGYKPRDPGAVCPLPMQLAPVA